MTSELAPATGTARAAASWAFEFEPHNCFACGSLNENGLRLDLHLGERRSWAEVTLDSRFEGWAGVAHGGIVATLLDEVMAWSLVAEDNWGVTARMTIDFRRPTPIGLPLRAEGWIVRARRRLVDTAGQIADADGVVLASAEGRYLAADAARKQELQARYGYRVRTERHDEVATPDGVASMTGESRR